jgi:hypothetical protein
MVKSCDLSPRGMIYEDDIFSLSQSAHAATKEAQTIFVRASCQVCSRRMIARRSHLLDYRPARAANPLTASTNLPISSTVL